MSEAAIEWGDIYRATNRDNTPTPGYLFNDIVQNVAQLRYGLTYYRGRSNYLSYSLMVLLYIYIYIYYSNPQSLHPTLGVLGENSGRQLASTHTLSTPQGSPPRSTSEEKSPQSPTLHIM